METLVVDATPEKFINLRNNHQRYKRVDLFKDNSLELLKIETSKQPDLLMVDPPRSGFKELELFTKHYKPQELSMLVVIHRHSQEISKICKMSIKLKDYFSLISFPRQSILKA